MGDDYMHLLIRQFHHATREAAEPPLVPVEVAIRNLELQLQILEAA